MFDKLKKLFDKPKVEEPKQKVKKEPELNSTPKVEEPTQKAKVKRRKPKTENLLSEKEKATAAGEPYVSILKIEINPNNINDGSFELDFNDKFVINLIKAGYKLKETDTDSEIVDRWFQNVCRNVVLEMYDQLAADPLKREMLGLRPIQARDIGNGRTEVS